MAVNEIHIKRKVECQKGYRDSDVLKTINMLTKWFKCTSGCETYKGVGLWTTQNDMYLTLA